MLQRQLSHLNGCNLEGAVACSCNPAAWRPDVEDNLSTRVLVLSGSRSLDVRTKLNINMGGLGEPGTARLENEGRIVSGGSLATATVCR
jgi:hypothetical protein